MTETVPNVGRCRNGHCRLEHSNRLDFLPRRFELIAAGRAETAGEVVDRLGEPEFLPGKILPKEAQLRGFLPFSAFECIPGRSGSIGISHFEVLGIGSINFSECRQKFGSLLVPGRLQHGVHQVVHTVQPLVVMTWQVRPLGVGRRRLR
jgi:hypothetical protein